MSKWSSPFPPNVGFCVLDESAHTSDYAHPHELAALPSGAVARRKHEFALGRIAARRAIETLGLKPEPVLVGRDGEPLWPEGLRGSITHSAGMAAAAVVSSASSAGLGLDIADSREIGDGVEGLIADAVERRWTAGDPLRIAMLFSAKESIFKSFHRLRREYFGFEAVRLRWHDDGFDAKLREAMGPDYPIASSVRVECRRSGPLVLTALLLPRLLAPIRQ